eukprot:TRINITY_DN14186_c0_g1_i2.p1 TRINITY_DN14186_c0_g1~~TRINITY_DN14186_c0_g1_i2.p1  ORF type:complete len:149 (-),score=18.53 TRINITY_DN14186_c0_g1_i2:47-493(-)
MLRSLVGSEMCIRDRNMCVCGRVAFLHMPTTKNTKRTGNVPSYLISILDGLLLALLAPCDVLTQRPHGHAVFVSGVVDGTVAVEHTAGTLLGPISTHKLSGHCLLYTSDAADEEDSVDLGGRRIIKKKKKKTERLYRSLTKKQKQKKD